MKRTFVIDWNNNLMQIGNVTKRLPIKQCCDCEFSLFTWDGDANRGVVTFKTGFELVVTDDAAASAFCDMFDLELPQPFPEMIGAKPQMDEPDQEWIDLLARHDGTVIEFAALIDAAMKSIQDERAAKQAAADAKAAVFHEHMNTIRREKGIPEVDYAARA